MERVIRLTFNYVLGVCGDLFRHFLYLLYMGFQAWIRTRAERERIYNSGGDTGFEGFYDEADERACEAEETHDMMFPSEFANRKRLPDELR